MLCCVKPSPIVTHHFALDVQYLLTNGSTVYVITTKDKSFTLELLSEAGVDIDESRVFGLGSGPKETVLATILTAFPNLSR